MDLPETLHPALELPLRALLGTLLIGPLSYLLLNTIWGFPIGAALGALFLYYSEDSSLPALGRPQKKRLNKSPQEGKEGSASRGVNDHAVLSYENVSLLERYVEKYGASMEESQHIFDQLKWWLCACSLVGVQAHPTEKMSNMWKLFMENDLSYKVFCTRSFHQGYLAYTAPITGKRLHKQDVLELWHAAMQLRMGSRFAKITVDEALWFDHETTPPIALRPQVLHPHPSQKLLEEEMLEALMSIGAAAKNQPVFSGVLQEVQKISDEILPTLLSNRIQVERIRALATRYIALLTVEGIATDLARESKKTIERRLADIYDQINKIRQCVADQVVQVIAISGEEIVNNNVVESAIRHLQESGEIARDSIQETQDVLTGEDLKHTFDRLEKT